MAMIDKYCNQIFRHPCLYLSIIILITIGCAFLYSKLPVETSVESLIMEDDPDLLFHNDFKEQFGEDEFLVAAFSDPDIFTPDFLRFIERLTGQLEDIEEVREVVSLTNVENVIGSENDFTVEPLIKEIPDDPSSIETIRRRALSNPLIRGNIISNDGGTGIFLIRTKSHPGDETYDSRLIKNVEHVLASVPDQFRHMKFHIAGWLVTDVSMSGYMNKDLSRFMPLTYLLMFLLLYLFLRNMWAVLLSVLNVSACLLCTMAALYLTGGAVSPMTAILPPLIMALSVSDCIHIFTEFLKKDRSQGDLPRLMRETLRHLWVPCFLTSLTTAIGFASLYVSNIPPIRQFGLAAAAGMVIEFCLSVSIIPLGIYFLRGFRSLKQPSHISTSSLQGFVRKLGVFIPRARFYILGVSILLAGLSVWGAFRLNVETNLIEYFREKSRVQQDFRFVDDRMGGVNTLEVSFQSGQPDGFLDPENLKAIEMVAQYLREQPEIGKVISINDFLKQMNRSFHNEDPVYYRLPDSREMAAQYLLLYGGDELENFIDENYEWARLSARVTEHSSRKLKADIEQLGDFIRENLRDSDLKIRITGKTYLVNKLVKSIVDSQVKSLALAFLVIFGVLFFVFRSFSLGLISVIPNTIPIMLNLGLMGLAGIPLNTATAIISAVAIGIAVDDTIHFLNQYRNERQCGSPVRSAAVAAIENKGVPMMTTSLILMVGFGILIISNFVPTAQFGFLSSMIMLFALIGDLMILPAILMLKGE